MKGQIRDVLNMIGMREHVHGLRFPQIVQPLIAQELQIARLRGRVAADVHDPRRRKKSWLNDFFD